MGDGPVAADVTLLLDVEAAPVNSSSSSGEAGHAARVQVPMAILVDGDGHYSTAKSEGQPPASSGGSLTPEAHLHGLLLAKDGWLVLRVGSEVLQMLLSNLRSGGAGKQP